MNKICTYNFPTRQEFKRVTANYNLWLWSLLICSTIIIFPFTSTPQPGLLHMNLPAAPSMLSHTSVCLQRTHSAKPSGPILLTFPWTLPMSVLNGFNNFWPPMPLPDPAPLTSWAPGNRRTFRCLSWISPCALHRHKCPEHGHFLIIFSPLKTHGRTWLQRG